MAVITPKQVAAAAVTFGIARAVIDDLKPADGQDAVAFDNVVFEKTMEVLKRKEAENGVR
jgi:hypothetical protein